MITTFKYKGTIIETPNLEKKLKRMKLTLLDIKIIPNKEVLIENNTPDIDTSIKMYKWYNTKTKHTLTSVEEEFPIGLEKYLGDKNDWVKIN